MKLLTLGLILSLFTACGDKSMIIIEKELRCTGMDCKSDDFSLQCTQFGYGYNRTMKCIILLEKGEDI